MKFVEVAILGAGIAGLAAAKKASEKGIDYEVFEAAGSCGGLLDKFEVNGFRFDNAVHLSFAKEQEVRDIFDKEEYITHIPAAMNFEHDKWLKHPVQNNLCPLSAKEKVSLIKSFIERPDCDPAENYESWLISQYGYEIANRYPIKYTHKYWQHHAKELSTTWIGSRLRRAAIDEVLFGAMTNETPNDYYVAEMRYPVRGGFKSFIRPLIEGANVRVNHKVSSVDLDSKIIEFHNGVKIKYSKIVNTIPLPEFINLCSSPVNEAVKVSAKELVCTSIDLISVAFKKNIIKDLWFYIYDEDIYASRAHSPSVKSPDNAPAGMSSLQFEVYNPTRKSRFTESELEKNTIYALRKMGIANDDDILFIHHKNLPWGNVVFKTGMEEHRKVILDYISNKSVKCAGRFGEWDYLWSNQSFMSGYNSI
ncbi:TPA: NAD(P)/FAD-dependent oxidoreductase [Citrobacter murliniae]